jgi:hypothetical protein
MARTLFIRAVDGLVDHERRALAKGITTIVAPFHEVPKLNGVRVVCNPGACSAQEYLGLIQIMGILSLMTEPNKEAQAWILLSDTMPCVWKDWE